MQEAGKELLDKLVESRAEVGKELLDKPMEPGKVLQDTLVACKPVCILGKRAECRQACKMGSTRASR
jgi:hypothetical protein